MSILLRSTVSSLILLSIMILGAVSALAQQPTIEISIAPAKDGAVVNATASYVSKPSSGHATPGALVTVFHTNYLERENILRLNFSTKFSAEAPTAPSAQRVEMELKGSFESVGGEGIAYLKGHVVTENGTANFFATLSYEFRDVVLYMNIDANATANKSFMSPDALSRLSLMEMMLTPQLINAQLAKQNVTWIKFEKVKLSHEEKEDRIIFSATAAMELNYSDMVSKLGFKNLSALQELIEVQKSLNQSGVLDFELETAPRHTAFVVAVNAELRGDIEKYFRVQGEYLARVYTSAAPPDVLKDLKPWLELVPLPSNTSLRFSVIADRATNETHVELRLVGLRIGHLYLRGDEATKRVAELLVTMLEAAKLNGLPIEYRCSVPGVEPIKELLPAAEKVVTAAIHGEIKSKYLKRLPFVPPPPPVVSPTPTTSATMVIVKTATHTVSKETTVTLVKTVTKLMSTTMMKTVVKTLVKTVTETLTKQRTIVTTVTITTTVQQTSTTPIAIGLAIAAIGVAIAVLGRRRV